MLRTACSVVAFFFWGATLASSAETLPEDRAVIGAMRQADAALKKFHVLRRTSINDDLDTVLVIGGAAWSTLGDGAVTWGPEEKIGIFLQDRHNRDRVPTEIGTTGLEARTVVYIENISKKRRIPRRTLSRPFRALPTTSSPRHARSV